MKPHRKKRDGSWLTRFLARGQDKAARKVERPRRPAPVPSKPEPKQAGHSPFKRSIAEIRHLMEIGKRDPERLAMMVRHILESERSGKRDAHKRLEEQLRRLRNN